MPEGGKLQLSLLAGIRVMKSSLADYFDHMATALRVASKT